MKDVIDGLSGSGDNYKDAVEYLCERYDKIGLIHRKHVCSIVEAPSLKKGSGRELRRLHDVLSRHLRALTARDPYGPFVTALWTICHCTHKVETGPVDHVRMAETKPGCN